MVAGHGEALVFALEAERLVATWWATTLSHFGWPQRTFSGARSKSSSPAERPRQTGEGAYAQPLTFGLRVAEGRSAPLPLEPRYVGFEDPAYNRALGTAPARTSRPVTIADGAERRLHLLSLAADRCRYNPNTTLAALFDWDDRPPGSRGTLRIRALDESGVARDLVPADGAVAAALTAIAPGRLIQVALDALVVPAADGQPARPARLLAGQTLQLRLDITLDPAAATGVEPAFLNLDVVADPVTPAPSSAYGLLARHGDGGVVECARFAWGPEPARIELVCAADMAGEVVRRRAVFRWDETTRVGSGVGYAVQKIATDGATHVPDDFVTAQDV